MPADLLRDVVGDLLDLLLPAQCAGCASPARLLCTGCRTRLAPAPDLRVLPSGLPVGLAGPYDAVAREALLAHKEHGRLGLARPLGAALAVAVSQLELAGPLLLVPVPSARAVVRRRGHDHARRLALAAARDLRRGGVPAAAVALLRQQRTPGDQAGLDARARAANLAGALAARRAPPGQVVVVDDVLTTGATLTEAARALCAVGSPPAGGAVVAGTALRRLESSSRTADVSPR